MVQVTHQVLGGLVHIGLGNPVENICCQVILDLLELEAAVCLCTAISLKLLDLNIFIPLALQVLVTCGLTPLPGGGRASFARDMLVENLFWTVGGNFVPQFQCTRRITMKSLNCLPMPLRDGNFIWEFSAVDQLLDYIQICFLCLLNSINETAYDVLKEQSS
ncbi:hypothetical protein RJ639_040047 [Escallonia herrerae]|uniref:Hydrophobic seed protein domain-containing protein n=1 Tax=Escallonia herrerae TaxID=1293975 RepID=A0AA88WP22_9ASTE|nr:hypothetical protein RJ639_023159 [Escallonia herrerae]KAK3028478.1 hypothetical protein RJ639_040047 [Escallonia herrerae]